MRKGISLIIIFASALFSLSLKAAEKSTHPEIEIKAELTSSGYTGEALRYEIKLISNTPEIADVRIIESPAFPEDVKVIKGVSRNSRPEKITHKGKTYYSWTIMRNFLIPSKPGKLTVGGSKFVVFVPHETVVYHEFWGSRRRMEYEEIKIDCKSIATKISALPDNKTGKEYSGCEGNFKIEGWFPPGKISKGVEAYAVFSINGYGSLDDLKLPNLYKIFDKGCHLREVEQNEEQMQREGRLYSEVTLTCRFVPDEEEFTISPLSLLFFNPETKKYYEESSEALHWTSHPEQEKGSKAKDAIEI